MFLGDTIAASVQIPIIQQACHLISQHKMQVFFAIYLLNMVGSQMLSTGAFEVFVNGELIYSKLQTGRLPDATFLRSEIGRLW